jgi:hypothetical protein
MRARRKSTLARARDVAPVFVVIGIGVAAVFVAMNVLVTAAPVPIDQSPSPSVSALPSFPSTPSILPASVTSIQTPAQTASLPAGRPTIVNSALSASASNRAWTVYLGYPAFVEGTTPWADDIDADILGELQTRAAQWEQGPAANRQAGAKVNTLSGTFTTELLTPALASFTMTWVDDSSPSGPGTSVETLNYDLSTGQRIAFDDLFIDSSNALAVISSAAVPLLQQELGADYDPSIAVDGTAPSPSNYDNWSLTPSGMKITFAVGQVSSRGPTLPAIVVPWSSLRQVMVQTGPVATLAGF